jgi:hypothetical protein
VNNIWGTEGAPHIHGAQPRLCAEVAATCSGLQVASGGRLIHWNPHTVAVQTKEDFVCLYVT